MNAQSSARLMYKDLDSGRREIRLITIKASTTPDLPVECSLQTASLDDGIHYLALSYTWGDSKITQNIFVNGFEIPVTTNLAAALRQLRKHRASGSFPFDESPSWLWVDAICINQGNIPERSSQVRIMGEIYRQAEKVVSWIGPEADRSTLAMSAILSMFREISSLGKNDDRFAWLERYPALTSFDVDQPNVWSDIDFLWRRNYWSRVWILQETVLGRDVLLMCGDAPIVSWKNIITIRDWAESIEITDPKPSFITSDIWRRFAGQFMFNPTPIEKNETIRGLWNKVGHEFEVKDVAFAPLQYTMELEATDPRDKVFGLLGVMDVGIIPDYSILVRDVYLNTASEFLRQMGLEETLGYARRGPLNPYGLPSWIPDWSRNTPIHPLVSGFLADELSVDELSIDKLSVDELSVDEEDTTESVSFHSEGSVLSVTGLRLSHVQELEPDNPPGSIVPKAFCTAWHLATRCLEKYGDNMYVTGIPPLQALVRLLVQDVDFLRDDEKFEIPSESFFAVAINFVGALCHFGGNLHLEFRERCRANLNELGLATDETMALTFSQRFLGPDSPLDSWESWRTALDGNFAAYIKVGMRLDRTLNENRIFHTASYYLGVGPDTVQPGDLLYGLKDCDTPVLLRRTGSHYELIGTCLVQGLMEGEIRSILQKESNLEQIEIH